jgi:hypothetical protein
MAFSVSSTVPHHLAKIVADVSLSDLDDLADHLLVTHSVAPSF